MAFAHKKLIVVCIFAGLTAAGCSSVRVIRNPDASDTGVRYYRPKPYLLVTAADPTGRLVNMKMEYHPDFSEEYSIHPRGKTSLALKDGWNLVGVNTKEAPPKEEAPPVKAPAEQPLPNAVVSATNVPLGYYESVFEVAGTQKYLKGWRYIGATMLGGGAPPICHLPNCPNKFPDGCVKGPLFGLVFFNGVMTFRQLDEIANNQLCPMFVDPAPARNATPASAPSQPIGVREEQKSKQGDGVREEGPALKPLDEKDAAKKKASPPVPSANPPSASRPTAAEIRALVENLPPLPESLNH
jgi:hypothetical protein